MRLIFSFVFFLFTVAVATAQSTEGNHKGTASSGDSLTSVELERTIIRNDSLLFDAYNNSKLEIYSSFFSEDLEFYHDKGGLSTSKKEMVEATQRNVFGKAKRELLAGSIEVSPIPGYGAVEIGSHRFHNLAENSRSGYSKFVTVWKNENGRWRITRVISLHK